MIARLALVVGVLVSATSAAPVRFAEDVLPILRASCFRCHADSRAESNVRLDRRETVFSETTPLVVPGKPGASELLSRVTSDDPDVRMPPEGRPLSDEEAEILRRWIAEGATWDESALPSDDGVHWSFAPVRPVAVPALDDVWIRGPIDAFVLRRLRDRGIEPAPEADRRTLLRRLTYDLTGLPPTPEEVRAFLADDRPDAYERVVDRLLASPAYGERWGRHWLDVARYADTNGLDENVAHGNAWRYRDWVVDAWNSDLPYDRFVQGQLAGDLWPTNDEETRLARLTATGFLSLGPKVLAEVDETKMEMDIVDEQIDTVGKAFLGITLGCARCHDHKFDAITTADYYALAGIFKSTRTMDSFTKIARWHENDVSDAQRQRERVEHEARVASARKAVAAAIERANAAVRASRDDSKLPEKPEEFYPEETRTQLAALRAELESLEKTAPVAVTAMGVAEGSPGDVAIHERGSHLTLGPVVRRGFPAALVDGESSIADESSGRRELADWLTRPEHPLTARVIVNRVWGWHLGRGLVATPDNLGELGERPTHPELLDWLAGRLVADGWSLKSLHRRIVTSSTYRQSSRTSAEYVALDPGNRLLGRANVRRLEAEAIRDAMLGVSGELDRTMGGSILNTENRKFVFDHTSKDRTSYDSVRRSVYLPVVRNHLYDVFQLFDYSNASTVNGRRTTSTVAPQALFLMNSEFVQDRAAALATRALALAGDDRERIGWLYESLFGRSPSEVEVDRQLAFLARAAPLFEATGADDARRRAWAAMCHTLLASSEFLVVR